MKQGEGKGKIHPNCLFVWSLLACRFTLVRFTLVRFGCQIDWFRFLCSIKKFFNFANFFHNYLIFNAFQI